MELVDVTDSKSVGSNTVRVQVPPPVPIYKKDDIMDSKIPCNWEKFDDDWFVYWVCPHCGYKHSLVCENLELPKYCPKCFPEEVVPPCK